MSGETIMSDSKTTAVCAIKLSLETSKVNSCVRTTKGGTPSRCCSRRRSTFSSPFVSPLLKRPLSHDTEEKEKSKRCKLESESSMIIQPLDDDKTTSCSNTEWEQNACDKESNCRPNLLHTEEKVCMKSVQLQKRELMDQVWQKEETVRKLKMVKIYRKKNNLDHLKDLIDKWRSVSQEAAERLLERSPDPKPTMGELLNCLQIDHQLIKYSGEDEDFY